MGRPRMGFSPTLKTDPRDRQNNAHGVDGSMVSAPLDIDPQGRLTIRLDGPLFKTPQGTLDMRVEHGLGVRTGSPQHIVVRTSDSVIVGRDGNLHAHVTAQQVIGLVQLINDLIGVSPAAAGDTSYREVLLSAVAPGDTPQPLFNAEGTDWEYSELLH